MFRIAFFVDFFPYPWVLNQVTGLLDLGHDVDIFADFNPKKKRVHPEVETYHLMEKVYYFDVPFNKLKRLLGAISFIAKNFTKAPLAILKSLNIFRYGKEALSLRILYTLFPFIRGRTYDIIHCHWARNGERVVFLRDLGLLKGKIVIHLHGYDIGSAIRQKRNKVYQNLFGKGDLFIAGSNYNKEYLISLGCDEKKIVRQPVGVDCQKFEFKPRRLLKNTKVKILTIARLVEKKGIEYSIKAVAKVVSRHPDIEYNIAGEGPLREELEHLISDLGAKDKIHLLGELMRNEIIKLMEESHIFILSSVTAKNGDIEEQGVVLQEAQAMGLPVLSTFHDGIPEGVIDGKAGFLVPERDVDALAEKLLYLIEHPEQWPEMGYFGRQFVEENYDLKKINQKMVKIYQELLS
jgi:colanic acid/amylovoran biosynthesis glycosyltransferase